MKNLIKARHLGALFVSITVVYCGILLLHSAQGPHASADQYWQLKTGADLLYTGSNPNNDQYSFTFYGERISQHPIAFQIVFALLEQRLGLDDAIVSIRLLAAVIWFLALLALLRSIGSSAFISIIAICSSVFFFEQRLPARPELFDHTLLVLGFYLYARTLAQWNNSNLLICAAFLFAWINFHAAILGYVIFAGLFLDRLANSKREGWANWDFVFWAFWGLVFLLIGFANSALQHPVLEAIYFPSAWDQISEHKSSIEFLSASPYLYAMWFIGGLLVCWSAILGRYGLSLTLLVFIWASVDRSRMVTLSGVALVYGFCLLATDIRSKALYSSLKPAIQKAIKISGVVMAVLIVHDIQGRDTANNQAPHPPIDDSVDYLKATYKTGNVLNDYNWGGYLIYRMAPEFKVFIDGRTNILYPLDFFEDYVALTNGNQIVASQVQAQYAPDVLLWGFNKRFHPLSTRSFNMKAEYIGRESILYSKRGSLQKLSNILIFPMCIDTVTTEDLLDAQQVLTQQSPVNEPLLATVRILAKESELEDQKKYNEWLSTHDLSKQELAVLGHWALREQKYSLALDFWNGIPIKSGLDRIFAAYAATKSGDIDWARTHLTLLMLHALETSVGLPDTQLQQIRYLTLKIDESAATNAAFAALSKSFFDTFGYGDSGKNAPEFEAEGFVVTAFCEDITD